MQFPESLVPWPTVGVRRASVNSFGYGGTNGHIVLDDAYHYLESRGLSGKHHSVVSATYLFSASQSQPNGSDPRVEQLQCRTVIPSSHPRIFVLSAADEGGLKRLATAYHAHLSKPREKTTPMDDTYLDNLAHTLACKRSRLPWKSFIVADSLDQLKQYLLCRIPKPLRSSSASSLAYVFTGQGAQWALMGRELQIYPMFRKSLIDSDDYLRSLGCEWHLLGKPHSFVLESLSNLTQKN